ncbi:MAG TPA: GtrA family protein [Vineibacter sp.]|nr:GtrA family protein [Vineibacter sp.]
MTTARSTAAAVAAPAIAGRRRRLRELASFGVVGAVGFAVDGGLLTLLVAHLAWGPISARVISFPAAVFVTWFLNRVLTFRAATRASAPSAREYGRYFAVQIVGALVNVAVYAGLVSLWSALSRVPLIPLAMAASLALVVNYLGTRGMVFRANGAAHIRGSLEA